MTQPDAEFWKRARKAQDRLVEEFLYHPEVSLIDIGLDPAGQGESDQIVLRVHLRQTAARQELGLPSEIDGIPVRVITADYGLERP